MQKRSTAGLPKAKNSVQDTKNTEKPAQKEPKRDPALKKGAQNLREATKTQQSIITERRRLRKHKTGLKKTREGTTNDNQSDNTTSDSPDACASQFAKNTGTSSTETLSFQPCSNKTEWVPSAQDCVHAHPLQMGGLPLSFIYIYIYICADPSISMLGG